MDAKKKEMVTEEPQIIANIDINLVSPREMFLEEYNNCVLCGTELIYTHNTDFVYNAVEEEAHCPHCNIRTKKNHHGLQ